MDGREKKKGLDANPPPCHRKGGAHSLYGGLSAHLMRVVPNAAMMNAIYEGILRWGASR